MKWRNGSYSFVYLMLGKVEIGSVGFGCRMPDQFIASTAAPFSREKSGFATQAEAKLWVEDQAYRDASDIQRSLGEVVSKRGVQAS